MYDLIVIGGGPAGLVAAVYAVRQRLNVLLVTENLGGKMEIRSEFRDIGDTSVIRGRELVERFRNEVDYLRVVHRLDRVRGVRRARSEGEYPTFAVSTESGETLESRSLIVASGCRFKPPRIPGAAKYLLKGIGYSAVSYAHLFLDRTAVVIGNDSRAVRSALQLARSAGRVYLLPEQGGFVDIDLDGSAIALLRALENATVLADHRVIGFDGDSFAAAVVVKGPDGSEKRIEADGFFLESKATPNSDMVAELVERDSQGYIAVDSRNHTSQRGIAAAGDVTNVHREQVLVAVGEGAKAALSIQEYLFQRRR